jgi:AcrR family transcriptional regulator
MAPIPWWDDSLEKPPREQLSRRRIVDAAIELLDTEGLDALSMRRLAAHLGVGAPSLYWHIPSKERLLAIVLDEVMGQIELPAEGSWDERLRQSALNSRRVFQSHPGAVPLLARGIAVGPNTLRLIEWTLGVLCDAGFSDADVARAFVAINTISWRFSQGPSAPVQTWTAGHGLTSLDAELFPNCVELAEYLSGAVENKDLEFALEALIDGLRQRLATEANTAQARRDRS